jgi:biotin carboxyl carrier protein
MKLIVKVEGESHDVEIDRNGSHVTAVIDGRSYDLDASQPEPSVWLVKHNARIYEAAVSLRDTSEHVVSVNGAEFAASVIDPKRLRGSSIGSSDDSGRAEIRTAMPGKVVRILASQGDAIEKGDGVIVVEAMKMQNEMKSPKDGTISEIKVAEGDTVGAGDVLVIID